MLDILLCYRALPLENTLQPQLEMCIVAIPLEPHHLAEIISRHNAYLRDSARFAARVPPLPTMQRFIIICMDTIMCKRSFKCVLSFTCLFHMFSGGNHGDKAFSITVCTTVRSATFQSGSYSGLSVMWRWYVWRVKSNLG